MLGWSPRDDAMLLLGAYLYGFGSWDLCVPVPVVRPWQSTSSIAMSATSVWFTCVHQGLRVIKPSSTDAQGFCNVLQVMTSSTFRRTRLSLKLIETAFTN